jgi:hypothetical protein
MNRVNVKADELSAALEAQLSKYNQDVNDQLAEVVDKSITKLVKLTKASAPRGKRNGQFAKNIAADKRELKRAKSRVHVGLHGRVVSATWYVKAPDYRLTHLIVHGHDKKNGGRTRANPFLKNAVDQVIPEYEQAVQEVLSK